MKDGYILVLESMEVKMLNKILMPVLKNSENEDIDINTVSRYWGYGEFHSLCIDLIKEASKDKKLQELIWEWVDYEKNDAIEADPEAGMFIIDYLYEIWDNMWDGIGESIISTNVYLYNKACQFLGWIIKEKLK